MKVMERGHPRVLMPDSVRRGILHAARAGAPQEICGLLEGPASGWATNWAVMNNGRSSPTAFLMDPREYRALERQADRAGLRLTGVFHSHPRGHSRPSRRDRDMVRRLEGTQGEWFYLICGLGEGEDVPMRAWQMLEGRLREIPVILS